MTSTHDHHPDLEEVLRDIAADPRARLLRARSSADFVRVARDEAVGNGAPGLRAAERELLRVHREEVARLLRERCVMALYGGAAVKRGLIRTITLESELEIPSKKEWEEHCRIVRFEAGDPFTTEGLSLIEACISNSERVTPLELARASSRLVPTVQASLYEAFCLSASGHRAEAREIYRRVIVEGTSPFLASYVWDGVGRSFALEGDHSRALEAYDRAAKACPEHVHAFMPRVVQSALGRNEVSTVRALAELDERIPADHKCVDEFIRALRWSLLHANSPSTEAAAFTRQVGRFAGATGTRILDALVA